MSPQAAFDWGVEEEEKQLSLFALPEPKARDYGLRWYQEEAKASCEALLRSGANCLVCMATGTGKTRLFGAIAGDWPGDVLILAHRDELVEQARRDLEAITGETVEVEQGPLTSSSNARIVVGSIQSFNPKRLARLGPNRFKLVILDECFPAGTMVDGRPIETIRRGDMVRCVDHDGLSYSERKVTRVFDRVYRGAMMQLRSGETTVVCTPEHPVYVRGVGYVEAKSLVPGHMLCLRSDLPVGGNHLVASEGALLSGVPLPPEFHDHVENKQGPCLRENEGQESDASSGREGCRVGEAEGDRTRAPGQAGERPSADRGGDGHRHGVGVGHSRSRSDEDSPRAGISPLLQTGRGQSSPQGGYRGGRSEPLHADQESSGREEGRFLAFHRLDSVESVEQAGPDGIRVYNLEVEGAHTYFANDVLVHNCHHGMAKTYRRVLEFFKCPRLGVTATPDRGDEKALGRLFEHVAYEFHILDGIEQGYLVPVELKVVELTSLDISHVAKTAGDLVAAQLDEAMLKSCAHIVEDILKYEPDRQGIIFMPGVKSAELGCQLMNARVPGSSIFISGETDKDERRQLVADFKAGKYRYLWNCQVATEGFDAPAASLVVMGRPTLSRALYAQMAGRGTRTLGGVVDTHPGRERADLRREAIALSDKPNMVILDFVGNSGKHSLASVVDVLGGSYTDEERAKAKEKLKEKGSVQGALEAARQELRKIALSAKAQVKSTVRRGDPFTTMHLAPSPPNERRTPMTSGQVSYLTSMGMKDDEVRELSREQANRVISANKARRNRGLATFRQLRALQKFGVTQINLSTSRASDVLNYLIGEVEGGRRPDMAHVETMLSRKRDAGDFE